MIKKFMAAIAMTAVITASLFTTLDHKAEAATYNYHTKAIAIAKANLGVPYRWGGMSRSGFDCSGFVKYSYGRAGRVLNRTAAQMYYYNGKKVPYAHPGDLLFFAPNKASKPTHVAIYLGYGKMIMASSSKGVIITSVNNVYWKPRYIGAKHV